MVLTLLKQVPPCAQSSGDSKLGRKDDKERAEQWLHQFCNSNNESSALSAERTPSNCQGTCNLCENLASWAMPVGISTRGLRRESN